MRISKSYIFTSHFIYTGPVRISFTLFSKKSKKLKNLPRCNVFWGQDAVNHTPNKN